MSPTDLVREGYVRYDRHDIAGVFDLLSPDIEISQTTDLPWGGSYRGHEGAKRFFAALNEHTVTMPRPTKYIPAGPEVAVLGRLMGTARATGNPIDLDIVHIWTVRDGLLARFSAYIDTPGMLRALGIRR